MSIFDEEAPNYTLSPKQRKIKALRDQKWRKAAARRRDWTPAQIAEEAERLECEKQAFLEKLAKRA